MTSSVPEPLRHDYQKRHRLRSGAPLRFQRPPDEAAEAPEEKLARTIQAQWLFELGPEIATPIDIENAIIEGAVSAAYAGFRAGVRFAGCHFSGPVDFSFARFEREADFRESTFAGVVSVRGAKFAGSLDIHCATFRQKADFRAIEVGKTLDASGARFGESDFRRGKISGDALFRTWTPDRWTVFEDEADFTSIEIGGEADFSSVQFAGKVTFDLARFLAGLTFRPDDPRLGEELVSSPSLDERKRVPEARFAGAVRFLFATIKQYADFTAVQCEEEVAFDGMVVDGDLHCGREDVDPDPAGNRRTRFARKVGFPGCRIQGQAVFTGVDFLGEAMFRHLRIEQEALFGGAVFHGDAVFESLSVGGPALFSGRSQSDSPRFLQSASFRSAVFGAQVEFTRAEFQGECTFQGARFHADTDFCGCRFGDSVAFVGAVVSQELYLQGATFGSVAVFREASARAVYFRDKSRSEAPDQLPHRQFLGHVDLRGFSYDRIYVAFKELLQQIEPFDEQPYARIEQALRVIGDDRGADDVYLARRKRTFRYRRQHFRTHWADVLQDSLHLLFNFGVRPVRILVVLLLFLAVVGPLVFTRSHAVVTAKDGVPALKPLEYPEAFGVSLRLLLPVEIPAGAAWRPSPHWIQGLPLTFEAFGTILRVMGSILVPLGLASLAGFLRRQSPKP